MAPAQQLRCGIVGAGRSRDGLGPFLATHLEAAGGLVVGCSGRSLPRAAHAAAELQVRLGHDVEAFGSIDGLLGAGLDALVIAAPAEVHLPVLKSALAAEHPVPVLCEKPFVRPTELDEVDPLLDAFAARDQLVMENCQWLEVLPTFFELHPDRAAAAGPAREVAMLLSPARAGPAMLEGSLSHLLSVVQALAQSGSGAGEEASVADLRFTGTCGPEDGLVTRFVLRTTRPGRTGSTGRTGRAGRTGPGEHAIDCRLELFACAEQPRPAWLAIDGARIDRKVDMATYRISFHAGGRKVFVDDPTSALVYRFLTYVREASRERNGMESDRVRQRARLFTAIVCGLEEHLVG